MLSYLLYLQQCWKDAVNTSAQRVTQNHRSAYSVLHTASSVSLGLWESRKFNTSSCKQWPKHYRQTNIIPNVCDQFPYYSLLYNSCYTKWGTCSLKFLKQIFSTVDSITAFKRKSAVCWGSASSLFIPRFLGACPWLMDKGTHKIK